MKKYKKLIIANWKMNPLNSKDARNIFNATRKIAVKLSSVQTVVCPPFIFLEGLSKIAKGHRCVLGAQDIFWENEGAHTGEVSSPMVISMGVEHVILGHSEKRSKGESSETVNRKVVAALKQGMKVILCIGEVERDEDGNYLSFIRDELRQSLAGVSRKQVLDIIIAYEPLWAIGKDAKRADTPESLFEMVIFIHKILSEMFGKPIAMKTPVLYGGSVNPQNAEAFLRVGGVSGLLVGRASRDPQAFSEILLIANNIKLD